MKKIITAILLIVMSFILSLSVACKNTAKQSDGGLVEGESQSESVLTPIPVEPSGDVNVNDVLSILNPILNNDYVNLTFSLTAEENGGSSVGNLNAYVKRTVRGYDAIVDMSVGTVVNNVNYKIADVKVYYVDGIATVGNRLYDGISAGEWNYTKQTVGNFNQLLNELNKKISKNASEEYGEVLTLIQTLKTALEEMELKNVNIVTPEESADMTDEANSIINVIWSNETTPIYDLLLSTLKIDKNDSEAVANFENSIKAYVKENPNVWAILENTVNSLLQFIPSEEKTDLKTIIDTIQQKSGVTTEEFVALINSNIEDEKQKLRAPLTDKNETIYEYVKSYLKIITLDKLVSQITGTETTAENVIDNVLSILKVTTVKQAVNSVIGYAVSQKEGQEEGGTDNTAPTQVDYFEMIKAMQVQFGTVYSKTVFRTDAQGRPIEFSQVEDIELSYFMQTEEVSSSGDLIFEKVEMSSASMLNVKIDYVKPLGVKFAIPKDVLEIAEDLDKKEEV
ncbi:MAG: hypothetical protein E7360_06525 [Clostridiales bacterium]|nr:hypothetical protein [Clostridiales bacterium]